MRRTEDHHNSSEQIEGYVREALQIAETCGLEGTDREVLLPVILGQVASKQVFYEQVSLAGGLQLPRPQG